MLDVWITSMQYLELPFGTPLPLGTLGYSYNELCAAADRFEVKISSKENANLIAAEFVSMTQQIVSRFSKPRETLVIT